MIGTQRSTRLQLDDGDVGLLPDTGAHDGLMGDNWARSQAAACTKAGKTFGQVTLDSTRTVQGVGNGTQSTNYA
eukprot:10464300-Karenia_brevis.AAC.1